MKTVNNAMNQYLLFANCISRKNAFKEDKNCRVLNQYFLNKDQIKTYAPNQVFSLDFSAIKTAYGIKWMHGAIDVISRKILFIDLVDDQTSQTVLNSFKKLPQSTKIINTDHGSSYLSELSQQFLKSRKIIHSMGTPGKSIYNYWIEDFWKRIKYEWFSQFNLNNLSIYRINQIIDEYKNYFNNKRISSAINWMSPIQYEKDWDKII